MRRVAEGPWLHVHIYGEPGAQRKVHAGFGKGHPETTWRKLGKAPARSQWARLEALLRNREFLAAYRAARDRWIAGAAIAFPIGTYWLRRFAHVPLAR
jgi:hypothetical protein